MADIAEQICLAVDQIVSERLKAVNFDTTIVATIVDNRYANQNRYTCSNGSAVFTAYSKDTSYELNESVQVTIPNNDYDQQKTIIGRCLGDELQPYDYVQPFNTIIDVSSNLVSGMGDRIVSLLANEDYDTKDEVFTTEIPLWSTIFEEPLTGYSMLGIQGQFRSWIKNLNPAYGKGNYGYYLEVLSNNGATIETDILSRWIELYGTIINGEEDASIKGLLDFTPETWYNDVKDKLGLVSDTNDFKRVFIDTFESLDLHSEEARNMVFAMLYVHAEITILELDSKDMYGDPNNFQSFFEQECVFNISKLKNVIGMSLFFYQKSNTFFTEKKEPLPYAYDTEMKYTNNLFTKDPYVCLGYNLSEFDSESAILFTLDPDTYLAKDGVNSERNKKTIRLRWLHQYENGEIKVINESSELTGYEVRWYRFKMGSPSADEYSGVYWERVEPEESSIFTYVLQPALDLQQEQVKSVILYDGKIIKSNILTFSNEKNVASKATADFLAGLSIWCDDNSYGNYFMYGQNNNLLDESKANEILTLKAKFAENSILSDNIGKELTEIAPDLEEAKTIIWEFPLKNSMIVVHGFNYNFKYADDEKSSDGKTIYYEKVYAQDIADGGARYKQAGYYEDIPIRVVGNTIQITRQGNENFQIDNKQEYRIGKTYNASALNNTIKCTIAKDNVQYSATKDLSFGLMGTNGTDATLVIDFDNNRTAMTANYDGEAFGITARLYDFNHEEVDFNNSGLNLKCEWSWYEFHEFTESQEEAYYQAFLQRNGLKEENLTSAQKKQYRNQAVSEHSSFSIEPGSSINRCYVQHKGTLNLDNVSSYQYFLVIQVKVSGFGDYDLIAYKGIPIRRDARFRNVIGATEIIYDSSGHVDYYKKPYEMWWCSDEKKINTVLDTVSAGTEISYVTTTWELYNPYLEDPLFIGDVSSNNILKPAPVYSKNTDPYGAVCLMNLFGEDKRVWIQPLVILQNTYPSGTVNKWGGKEVQLNEGSILAPAIAAGSKDSSGRFSGVMLGDWSGENTEGSISNQTGLYGFHQGAQSFAFKEDGTAFLGKDGRGRIYFDGTDGTIKSAMWNTEEGEENGMFIDLDDGILKMQKTSQYTPVDLTSATYKKNTYYILVQDPEQVPRNSEYDPNKTYYIYTLIPTGYLTEEQFEEKKTELYYKSSGTYQQCGVYSTYDPEEVYYTTYFGETLVTSSEMYDENKGKLYVFRDNEYIPTTGDFNPEETYYTTYFDVVEVALGEFNANKSKYYIKTADTYTKISSSDTYSSSTLYYEMGYEAQNFSIEGVSSTWNTLEDENLKSPLDGTTIGYYYLIEYKYAKSSAAFNPFIIYYQQTEARERYITLSSYTSQFPLAIGETKSEATRKFRVDWDGTTYITDGVFSGKVTATELQCYSGVIGGWIIGERTLSAMNNSLILDSYEGSITGGILASPTGGILLDGYFEIGRGNRDKVGGTYIGFMQANTGNAETDLSSEGVGMRMSRSGMASQVKATSYNAGLSYTQGGKGGYISISSSGMSVGVNAGCQFRLQTQKPEDQIGIYARFA